MTRTTSLAALATGLVLTAFTAAPLAARAATPNVLLVCPTAPGDTPGTTGPSLPCPAGTFSSIQAAVTAAHAGDWVLVAPGDYHEKGAPGEGVDIRTAGLHLRGMDRNGVVVDGTNPNGNGQCSNSSADQDTGGRNGIVVHKVNDTSIENLTTCNYLNGPNGAGNEIWWNGGDGTGTVGLGAFTGGYITGTSTYYSSSNMGMYGIFVSNSFGPGVITYAYAANMGDSAFYVGACPDCNITLNHVHAQNSALGYSGTNSGGHLLIENSEWDLNKAGIVPNSLNNDDAPPPQSGLCPGSTTVSCTLITGNVVHDNNNPNVPGAGIASAAPIGAGIELSGASFDTVDRNTVFNQGSWGIVVHDFPDTETPPSSGVSHCQGGIQDPSSTVCLFQARGDIISNNNLFHNGTLGNPGNSDLALEPTGNMPTDCFSGNTDSLNVGAPGADGAGVTSDPPLIQTVDGPPCTQPSVGDSALLTAQLACASGLFGSCPTSPAANYPKQTGVVVLPLATQVTMPNPCAGVPDNPWCSGGLLVSGPATNVPEAPLVALLPLALLALPARRLLARRGARGTLAA